MPRVRPKCGSRIRPLPRGADPWDEVVRQPRDLRAMGRLPVVKKHRPLTPEGERRLPESGAHGALCPFRQLPTSGLGGAVFIEEELLPEFSCEEKWLCCVRVCKLFTVSPKVT